MLVAFVRDSPEPPDTQETNVFFVFSDHNDLIILVKGQTLIRLKLSN